MTTHMENSVVTRLWNMMGMLTTCTKGIFIIRQKKESSKSTQLRKARPTQRNAVMVMRARGMMQVMSMDPAAVMNPSLTVIIMTIWSTVTCIIPTTAIATLMAL